MYGLEVASVRTLIAAGKKKRGKHGFYARPDVKKAFVTLKGGGSGSGSAGERQSQAERKLDG